MSRPEFDVIGQASDGEEAVNMVIEKQPDVVLMDIWMPRLSGHRCDAQASASSGLASKILVLSQHDNRNCVEEVLRAGASGYVVKSSSPSDLVQAIEAVKGGASYLSPAITQQVVDAIARPGQASPGGVSMLTDREREVLQLIAEGLSSKEIAADLGVSLKTVDSHRSNLMEKLDIHKVSGLVRLRFARASSSPDRISMSRRAMARLTATTGGRLCTAEAAVRVSGSTLRAAASFSGVRAPSIRGASSLQPTRSGVPNARSS